MSDNIILFINLLDNYKFILDKYVKENNIYNIYLLYNNNSIKIITDFDIYCLAFSEYYDFNQFNIEIIFNIKTPYNILYYLNINLTKKINIDIFNLHQNIDTFSKVNINYNELSKILNNNILLQDIKNINNNNNYIHYISYINNSLIANINNMCNFKLIIDNYYPNTPPNIELISPHFTFEFSISFMSLNILKLNNWNSSITLEQLLLEISKIYRLISYL